eukprot:SAG11_NODE_14581_length_607_cov_0.647638_1_plen_43_part_10
MIAPVLQACTGLTALNLSSCGALDIEHDLANDIERAARLGGLM